MLFLKRYKYTKTFTNNVVQTLFWFFLFPIFVLRTDPKMTDYPTKKDLKTVVEPYSDHKTSPLGPQKDKNDPKIKSNSNVTIQGIV